MQLKHPNAGSPGILALFSGGFHPPTVAHLAMAEAALTVADQVLFVLPREYPHKSWEGASLPQRLEWLEAAAGLHPRFGIGIADGGLFIDIARECRPLFPTSRLLFLCGRDAAERIVEWDYGDREPIERQLEEYELLVAARKGSYRPPEHLAARVHELPMPIGFDDVSSTAIRERMVSGQPWRHLVPDAVAALIEGNQR